MVSRELRLAILIHRKKTDKTHKIYATQLRLTGIFLALTAVRG
jgi:hypothetical protein